MRRNKEIEREVRTLQDRLNTLTTENKDLRNNLNTRRNSDKTDNEIKQDNSMKKLTTKKYNGSQLKNIGTQTTTTNHQPK